MVNWIQVADEILQWLKIEPLPPGKPVVENVWLLLFAVINQSLPWFVLALGLAVSIAGMIIVAHYFVMVKLVRKRMARVFISFQHERELIADALVAEMARRGIVCEKLPFVENPDHDELLDKINQAIRGCHVFVCVPGNRPSFVEIEVAMAFALEKPMLFILTEAETPRLPNCAKKGYPIFDLDQLQLGGIHTLIRFCSYLAADWRSTISLYAAVFDHIQDCAILAIATFSVMATAWARAINKPFLGLVWTVPWFILAVLLLFLVSYGLFCITRFLVRAKLRRVISGQTFSASFLPETLAYSLTRADLDKILYRGKLVAEHESRSR